MPFVNLRYILGMSKSQRRKSARRARLAVEALEARDNPSSLVVNSAADPASLTSGTLRFELNQADSDAASGQSDTITFAASLAGKTITLSQGALVLSGAGAGTVTIDAGSLSSLTISGAGKVQDFVVDSGVTAVFNKLTIIDGKTGTVNVEANYGGGINNSGTLTVNDSTFSGNFGVDGGGIANLETGTMTLTDSTVSANSAEQSAGGIGNLGLMSVTDVSVTGNHAFKQGGGIGNQGTMNVFEATIANNVVSGDTSGDNDSGGGIANGGTMTVSQSLISGNTAPASGGIGNGAIMTVTDSTIVDNVGTKGAGGVGNSGSLAVVNVTIVGNSAAQGGGLANEGSLTLTNSIIANNLAGTAPDVDADNTPIISSVNLIGSSSGLADSGISNGDGQGDIVGENAELNTLASNGGLTKTIALLSTSPALFSAGAVTTLANDVTDTVGTSVTVANGNVFSSTTLPLLTSGSYFTIQIDGEEMAVTGLTFGSDDAATLTVMREADDTTPTTHTSGANVFLVSDQRGVTAPFENPAMPSLGAYQSQGFITLTKDPVSETVDAGTLASFTAAASADPAATVQWQGMPAGTTTWMNLGPDTGVSGWNTDTLSVTANSSMSGGECRAVFTNSAGSVTSTPAKLTVDFISLTTGPANATVNAGQKATFSVVVSANPAPQIQWQVSSNGGTSWSNVSGATGLTLSFTTAAAENGNEYQAVIKNVASTITAGPATLTVDFISIAKDPTSLTVDAGEPAVFTAAANANPAANVQWQGILPGGTWTNLNEQDGVSGVNTDTLTVTAASNLNGAECRAVFTNAAGTVTTTPAKLTVDFLNVTSPPNQTIDAGQKVTFTAGVSANPTATIQWQVSSNEGGSWTNIAGATSAAYSFIAATSESGNEYQALIKNVAGSTATTAATLTVNPVLSVGTVTTSKWTAGLGGFTGTLTITGGTQPYQIKSPTGLPTGLVPSLTDNTISFTGTPTKAGTFVGSMTVEDETGVTVTKSVVIVIDAAIAFNKATLPAFTLNEVYSQTISVTGGTGTVTLSYTLDGPLPTGLTIAPTSPTTDAITITGKPTATGTVHINITATDSLGATTSIDYTLS